MAISVQTLILVGGVNYCMHEIAPFQFHSKEMKVYISFPFTFSFPYFPHIYQHLTNS